MNVVPHADSGCGRRPSPPIQDVFDTCEIFGYGHLDVIPGPFNDRDRVSDPFHQDRVVSAYKTVLERLRLRLPQHRSPKRLRRLDGPKIRPIERFFHLIPRHPLHRIGHGRPENRSPERICRTNDTRDVVWLHERSRPVVNGNDIDLGRHAIHAAEHRILSLLAPGHDVLHFTTSHLPPQGCARIQSILGPHDHGSIDRIARLERRQRVRQHRSPRDPH